MATQPVDFASINGQLDFSNTNPVTIDDTLVRALTGESATQAKKSPIAFSDLSGKVGVAPIVGATSNTQAGYFNPTISSLKFNFPTDIYNPTISWSTTLSSPAVLTQNGANAEVSLSRSSVGQTSLTGNVTASLYYDGTLIGSNTVTVSLSAQVYDSNISFVNSPSQNVSVSGFSAQTATVNVSLSSNVAGNPQIAYTVSPMDSGVQITPSGVSLSRNSTSVGPANTGTYKVTSTVSLDSQVIATGSETVVVSSQMLSNSFSLTTSGDLIAYSNSGNLTCSSSFQAIGNAATSTIEWSSSTVSGTQATFTSSGTTASLSLPVSNASVPYNAQTSITTVTASLIDSAHGGGVVSTQSKTVQLSGLTSGLKVGDINTPVIANGYTAQTATFQTSANVQSGSVAWTATATSGSGSVSKTSGSVANLSITTTISTIGSNSGVWSIAPVVSALGTTFFTGSSNSVTVTATMIPSAAVTISGPSSNVVVANSGSAISSVSLTASNVGPGTAVVWTATPRSGSATAVFNSSSLTANLTLTQSGNGYSYATYDITANCYDTSSNNNLSNATQTVTLESGVYGVSTTLPSTNSQSGYTAQTSTSYCNAVFASGTGVWQSTNSKGFSATTTSALPSAAFTTTQSAVGTNSQSYPLTLVVYDTKGNQVDTLSPGTVSISAQVNSYSVSTSSYTNTQIVTSASGTPSVIFAPTTDIPGGSFSGWALSSPSGAGLTSNSSAAVVSYNMAQNLSASNPGYSYTTTVSCNLLDNQGRLVTPISNTVTLRSYYANPSISFASSNAAGFIAQTASGTFTCTIVGATGANLAFVSSSAGSASIGSASSNTTYYSAPFNLSQTSIGSSSATASFNMKINYYEASYTIPTQSRAISAAFYDPAVKISVSNSSAAGFIPAQTAIAIATATCNSSVTNPHYIWGSMSVSSGAFSSTGVSGTGNTYFNATCSTGGVGNHSGVGSPSSLKLYSDGVLLSTVSCPPMSASATVYDPAGSISGPASATSSNLFESTSSLSVTASSNSSIPSKTYVSYASLSSGSAATVSYTSSNTVTNLSLDAIHQNLTSNYTVYVSIYCQGTLIQQVTKAVSLSASGTVPNYTLSNPGSVSVAGWNFAQTATQTITMNGMSGHGEYIHWGYSGTSGTTPSFYAPGGANSYINTIISRSSVGTTTGTGTMSATVYDPDGRSMKTIGTSSYTVSATVYNPAFSVVNGSNNVFVGTVVPVSGTRQVSGVLSLSGNSNSDGTARYYHIDVGTQSLYYESMTDVSQSASRGTSNTSYTVTVEGDVPSRKGTSFSMSTSVPYSASIVCNGQVIAGPVSGNLNASIQGTTTGTIN